MNIFRRSIRACPLILLFSLPTTPAIGQTFNFTTGTQNWNVNGNWTPSGFPNAIDASATFLSPTGTQSVNLGTGITVGTITLTNDSSSVFTLANGTGGSLTFQTSSGNANIFFNGTSTVTNSGTVNASVTLNSTLIATVNNTAATGAASSTFTGAVTGSGGFTKDGPGRFTFSTVAKAYTGPTIVNQGRLRYTLTGASTNTSSVTVNSGGQLFLDTAGAWSLGAGTITLNGAGTVEPTVGVGALRNNAGGTTSITNNITLASNSTIDIEGGTTTASGVFSGSATLTKAGIGGVLLFSNTSNSHTGNIVINSGTITYNSGVTLGGGVVTLAQSAGVNTIALRMNSSQTMTDPSTVWTDATGTRSQTIDTGSSTSTVLTINQLNNTTFGTGAVPTLTGIITGSGSIIKNGPGTLSLTGVNTYAGTTTINNGLISVSLESGFGANPASFTPNQITLNGGGIQAFVGGVDFSSNRGITLGPSGGTFDTNGMGMSSSTVITGPGSLTKIGGATLSLLNANTYGGNTFIQNGTLLLYNGNDRLPATTIVTLGSGTNSGVLQLGNQSVGGAINQTIAGLTNSGTGSGNAVIGNDVNNSVLTVNNTTNTSFSGTIGGAGANQNNLNLVKSGSGILALSGNNTYTGTTTINAGTLLVNGSHSSSDTYNVNGGTLGGSGSINADVNIFAATLAPGASPGRLTVNGNVTFSNTSTFSVQINGATVETEYDQLRIGSGGALSLNGATLVATLGFAPTPSDVFFLTDNQSGAIGGTFDGLSDGSSITIGPFTGTISYFGDFANLNTFGGNDVVIFNLTSAIPEPSIYALLGLTGFFGLQWYLRRKPGKVEPKIEDENGAKAVAPTPAETINA